MADLFSSSAGKEVPHDYESDAIVVHMGAFAAPALLGPSNGKSPQAVATTTDDSNPSGDDDDSCEEPPPVQSAQQQAATSRGANKATARGQRPSRRAQEGRPEKTQLVQLYSIAAPGMRRLAHDTAELSVCTAWCQPVRARPDWSQVQKDYFQAPGVCTCVYTCVCCVDRMSMCYVSMGVLLPCVQTKNTLCACVFCVRMCSVYVPALAANAMGPAKACHTDKQPPSW
jgi:hypothetical protein